MGQVGKASKSTTTTSKALRNYTAEVHNVAAKKAEGDDEEAKAGSSSSSSSNDPDKVTTVRYPKALPLLETTSLGPGHQGWLNQVLWLWTQYSYVANYLPTN